VCIRSADARIPGLENRRPFTGLVGSNPTLSARISELRREARYFLASELHFCRNLRQKCVYARASSRSLSLWVSGLRAPLILTATYMCSSILNLASGVLRRAGEHAFSLSRIRRGSIRSARESSISGASDNDNARFELESPRLECGR
jgi:hypothetical protein